MPLKLKVYNQNAEAIGEMELSEKVFGVKIKPALVHQAVVTQMANQRKVIAHTKTRSEVRGGGRKPWAQKGTGRARHGSSRSPIWIGGGVTFGPRNDRNFKMRLNRKMKQSAILMALSDKVSSQHFIVLDKLEMAEYKTKLFNGTIEKLAKLIQPAPGTVSSQPAKEKTKKPATKNQSKAKRSILVIVDRTEEKLNYSARNLTGVKLMNLDNLNIIDLLKYKELIATQAVVGKLEARYNK